MPEDPDGADPAEHHVLVLRHGQTQWNADGRWQGWTDVDLSETGVAQAEAAASRLQVLATARPFERVVASDLLRARRTAEIVAARLGVARVEVEPGLRERHIGDWAGRTTAEINDQWSGAIEAWRAGRGDPPAGEGEARFVERIAAALLRIVQHPPVTLVVSHGGVIRTLERHFGARPSTVQNLGGRWFGWRDGAVRVGPSIDLIDGPRPVSISL
jgi:probable phosphoglycerate mutase